MTSRSARFIGLLSLVLLIQLAVPWHALHMAALADQTSDQSVALSAEAAPEVDRMVHHASGSTCHGSAASGGDEPLIAGFCEWLCAQGQTAPWQDGLMAARATPDCLTFLDPLGLDSLTESVPTPPPIA